MIRNKLARLGGRQVISRKEILSGIGKWPEINKDDIKAVIGVLESRQEPWGFTHKAVKELQALYCEYSGRKFCLSVSSGTAALHLAIASLGVEAGSEVITPALGFIASATCILHHNCIPIFVDVDPFTFNIDSNKIEEKISSRTRAIICVDLLGLPVDYKKVSRIGKKYGIKIIEDASQAQGATYQEKRAGGLGHVSALSIMASKNLASCGEGGLIATDSKDIAVSIMKHASHGRYDWNEPFSNPPRISYQLGFNYRPTATSAAFALSQLKRIFYYQKLREERAELFGSHVQGISFLRLPFVPKGCSHAFQMYRVTVLPEALGLPPVWDEYFRDALVFLLRGEGVVCGFWEEDILPAMPIFQNRTGYGHGCPWVCHNRESLTYDPIDYPIANQILRTTFFPHVTRATNSLKFVRLQAEAFQKVAAHSEELIELTEEIAKAGGFENWSGVPISDDREQQNMSLIRK